jgi:hypothetical protein
MFRLFPSFPSTSSGTYCTHKTVEKRGSIDTYHIHTCLHIYLSFPARNCPEYRVLHQRPVCSPEPEPVSGICNEQSGQLFGPASTPQTHFVHFTKRSPPFSANPRLFAALISRLEAGKVRCMPGSIKMNRLLSDARGCMCHRYRYADS